jgi:HlyD family secretion protein
MKKVFILPLILLAACSGNKNLPDAYGNFETDEITISAENGGKITSFPSEEGSAIKLGEVLVMTDIVNLELQIDQMNAQTQAIEATKSTINAQIALADQQICNLQKDQLRIHKMAEDGAATAKQRDDIDGQIAVVQKQKGTSASQLNSIRKQVEALKAQQNVLQDKIKNSTIKSPINGTIIEKYAQIGELATPGKAVCKIADLSSLILRIYISENQLSEVKIGQKVAVSIDDKDKLKQIDGKIEWISSQAEFTPKIIQTREERVKLVYAVKIRVVNDGSLKIGMPGEVKFLEK